MLVFINTHTVHYRLSSLVTFIQFKSLTDLSQRIGKFTTPKEVPGGDSTLTELWEQIFHGTSMLPGADHHARNF